MWPEFGMVEDQFDDFQWKLLNQEGFEPEDGAHRWEAIDVEFDSSLLHRLLT